MDIAGILADLGGIVDFIRPHWAVLMYTFIFAFLGEISKRYVFTEANKAKLEKLGAKLWNAGDFNRIWSVLVLCLARFPFEFHPVIAGILVSFIPGLPISPGVHAGIQTALYFALCGVASLGLYDLIHGAFKLWWVYVLKSEEPVPEIHLPGEEDPDDAKEE